MKFTLDQHGVALPDTEVVDFVQSKVFANEDIHTSQLLVLDWVRAVLHEIPQAERPQVEWIIYGRVAHFNADLRSFDAWFDPRTAIGERALGILI